jgi:iron(II)-dependent oxidoreductase
MQRRYPWGDNMDRERANVWGSGPGRIVPVTEFGAGVSVGGVYQLIGNVWEWTSSNFGVGGYSRPELVLPTPMKSIHGGAYDTYFDNQATCQFQSGENPLGRRHNIGFRCAVGVCDLVLTRQAPTVKERSDDEPGAEEAAAEQPVPTAEEVRA